MHRRTACLPVLLALLAVLVPGAAAAQTGVQPMRFTLVETDLDCADCRYIRATGDIEPYTAAQFRRFVRSHGLGGKPLTVMLHSPGGDVIAGLRLGREIRAQGFNTQVALAQRQPRGGYRLRPGDCASACTFAFLGGVARFAEDGVIGVHRFFPGHLEPDNRVVMRPGDEAVAAMIKVYALDMGVDGAFIDRSLAVPPADMQYLSQAELRALAVVNTVAPPALDATGK